MSDECVFCALEMWDKNKAAIGVIEPLNPVTPGHLLFIPRVHVPDAASDPAVAAQVMFAAASYVGSTFPEGHGNLITSIGEHATQTVFHYHLHYVPRTAGDGLHLPWTGQKRRR